MEKNYQLPLIMDFLKDLALHNERPWFQENKVRYEEAKKAFDELTNDLIVRIGAFDNSVKNLTPNDCIYRIYRDVRFSQDKSPYKRHFGCFINSRGKNSLHGGYYFHLQPNESMLGGGCWWLPTKILNVVRQTIVDQEQTFTQIVEDPIFKNLYSKVTYDPLKTIPRGMPKDFTHPEYIKCRNYCVGTNLEDSFFEGNNWMDEIIRRFKLMKPFVDFINDTVDDYI
ncbi:MAG: DUF2461 domain-containing protein [Bacteroidaceae bacterium]|jgi:uncharacterized protein (TIGR02453 family)|nr:DUF2461 domain-containing protein [Bacteroidaceae bacterium]